MLPFFIWITAYLWQECAVCLPGQVISVGRSGLRYSQSSSPGAGCPPGPKRGQRPTRVDTAPTPPAGLPPGLRCQLPDLCLRVAATSLGPRGPLIPRSAQKARPLIKCCIKRGLSPQQRRPSPPPTRSESTASFQLALTAASGRQPRWGAVYTRLRRQKHRAPGPETPTRGWGCFPAPSPKKQVP